MAKLIFTLDEILRIVQLNIELPEQVDDLTSEGNQILLKLKPAKLIPKINIKIIFERFLEGKVFLKIKTPIPAKIISLLIDIFVKNPDIKGVDIDYPQVIVRVNELIEEGIKGLHIKDIAFEGDEFTIMT